MMYLMLPYIMQPFLHLPAIPPAVCYYACCLLLRLLSAILPAVRYYACYPLLRLLLLTAASA